MNATQAPPCPPTAIRFENGCCIIPMDDSWNRGLVTMLLSYHLGHGLTCDKQVRKMIADIDAGDLSSLPAFIDLATAVDDAAERLRAHCARGGAQEDFV